MKTMVRFARFIELEIENFIEDNNVKNTKRPAKVARRVFQEYLKEKKTTEPDEKTLLVRGLKTLWCAVSFIAALCFIENFTV